MLSALFHCSAALGAFLIEEWSRLLEELGHLFEKVVRVLELSRISNMQHAYFLIYKAETIGLPFIIELCCGILAQIIPIFAHSAAILEKKNPILEHPAGILENRHFIRT